MRNSIQLSILATVLLATASTADADSPHHAGKGPHGGQAQRYEEKGHKHGHDEGHGHGKEHAHGHGHAHGDRKGPAHDHEPEYLNLRSQEELHAALRDDRRDLKRISRVCSDWERFSRAGDYRRLTDTRRRLDIWLQQEIAESRRELRAAERELREAQRWGSAHASYSAVYHPHGDYRGYLRYAPDAQLEQRQVQRARRDLTRLQELWAQLRLSRAGAAHDYRLAIDATLLDELVRMSEREVARGEAQAAGWSASLQYARY
jgi:hypothetical protein